MVARVSHSHVSIRCERQALWTIERVCCGVDVGQERPGTIKHLQDNTRSGSGSAVLISYITFDLTQKGKQKIMTGCLLILSSRSSITDLYSAVPPVGNNDVPVGVHSNARRGVELSVPLAMGTKLKQELPVCTVHLLGKEFKLFRSSVS